jgi:A/G-specific adenine glycosylase
MVPRQDDTDDGQNPPPGTAFPKPQITRIQDLLLAWFRHSRRDLPWRRTSDPYRVWVSEIMLQQTRVTAVIPFYERFLARCPDVDALAAASESDLLSLWAGLGYYYRAHNMQRAARRIVEQGAFPPTFAGIRALPGVGDYTAAAISSISFGLPHAVVDGNVLRVLSRLLNDASDIATSRGKREFTRAADELLNRAHPGDHNQALMELGATVCLPRKPQCLVCPLSELCRARAAGTADQLPVKTKGKQPVSEERTLFWITRGDDLLVWQRAPESKLMPGFWELPESSQVGQLEPLIEFGTFGHSITFHRYLFRVVSAAVPASLGPARWVPRSSLESLPLSTITRKAIRLVGRKLEPSHTPKRRAASA